MVHRPRFTFGMLVLTMLALLTGMAVALLVQGSLGSDMAATDAQGAVLEQPVDLNAIQPADLGSAKGRAALLLRFLSLPKP